jgi:hypothetical protein
MTTVDDVVDPQTTQPNRRAAVGSVDTAVVGWVGQTLVRPPDRTLDRSPLEHCNGAVLDNRNLRRGTQK